MAACITTETGRGKVLGVSAEATPGELLSWAGAAMAEGDGLPAGVWQYATALLARQALDLALAEMWKARAPGLERRPAHVQLLCLPSYLDDRELAGRASLVWWSLTGASHHHPYELAPTAAELRGWLETVGDVIDGLQRATR
jgi:hypothetical protein